MARDAGPDTAGAESNQNMTRSLRGQDARIAKEIASFSIFETSF